LARTTAGSAVLELRHRGQADALASVQAIAHGGADVVLAAYPALVRLAARCGLSRFVPALRRRYGADLPLAVYASDRLLQTPVRTVRELAAWLGPHEADVIDLSLGAPVFDSLSPRTAKLAADERGYPPTGGLPELRRSIAQFLADFFRESFDPDTEILVTPGATGALAVVLDAFVSRGDSVVLLDPCHPHFPLALAYRGARIRWVPTHVVAGEIRFQLEDLARAMRRARLILLNSPCNPSGAMITREGFEEIAWYACRRDVLVVCDEVYAAYCYDRPWDSAAHVRSIRQRTLVLGSMSKTFALAAYRVGWIAGPCELLRACLLSQSLTVPFVSTLSQYLAVDALSRAETIVHRIVSDFRRRRDYVADRLRACGLDAYPPAGAFYYWIPIPAHWQSSRQFCAEALQKHRVLLVPGAFFGPSGDRYFRLSYAGDEARLHEGLHRLGHMLNSPCTSLHTSSHTWAQAA